ncbi:MAG: GGDEF domain-containing protein [Desulfobacteraceae bacterium]|nr:GGDEF domain-containing protein [Desulfobacteraceae bacterium]
MVTQLDQQVVVLKDRVKKLQSQKDSLIKELDTIEEKFENQDRLYRKYFPIIIDMVAAGDTYFARACNELSGALKKGTSFVKIAYIFEQLKTAMIKEGIGPAPVKKKKGFFASLMKSPTNNFIEDFKQSYHDILNNLRSTLDKKYATRMDNITTRILNAADTGDIGDIRESLFSLVFVYISETNQDREKVNSFVQDIVGKILDIEVKIATSYDQTSSLFSSNSGFETLLSSEMTDLQTTSNVTSSLDDLKIQITERLTSIETALKKKQLKDKAIQAVAEKNRHIFKSGFAKLKQELNEATQYSEKLEEKLNLDQLTGSFNRRAYDKKIEDEMERFLRYGTIFSLLVIDADKFKNINDRYGHAIGDKCLQEIIKRSIPLLRKNDMLARYGGEEFVVVMPETDAAGAKEAAEKIRQTIEKIEFLYKNETVKVTVSVGGTQVQEGDANHLQVFERADIAVYKAKENGRNQVLVH